MLPGELCDQQSSQSIHLMKSHMSISALVLLTIGFLSCQSSKSGGNSSESNQSPISMEEKAEAPVFEVAVRMVKEGMKEDFV